ncbi:TPA: hypothetical protein I8271_001409 [Kluyvera intermedia]|uniref:DUF5983 domain-containing protein n=2 Tax=Kluyvera intermedia TaxID=61648 RepID=A0A9P3T6E8_KLUIN|nr:hypothetical protein [Kluyvera intermedia]HAT2518519.1 hypothetical protein [Kluyvera intermedia]HAT2603925.1 hypothetical protein [Kluyvera intermedia]HAT2609081.1 hypothetical protein [Kluyvera intermedia]HAT2680821.1 hypothetical protein [Kluyvera intermedia]
MKLMTPAFPLHFIFNGIQFSTAHITDQDNECLYQLSHDMAEYGDAEWIYFTGTGYLLRLSAWWHPLLCLKKLGLSKSCRRLVSTMTRQYSITTIHLDAATYTLPGLETFDW